MAWHIFVGLFYCILCCILACLLNNNKRKLQRKWEEVSTLKGYPILGMVPLVKSPLYRYLMILRITYGKLFKLRLGMRDITVVNDSQMAKKVIQNAEERIFCFWKSGLSRIIDDTVVEPMSDRVKMTQQARITRILTKYLSSKDKLNEIVQNECHHLLEDLKNLEENSIDVSTLFPLYSVNIITEILMKKRFFRDDSKFKVCQQAITIGTKNRDLVSLLYLMFPQFEYSSLAAKTVFWLFSKLKIFEDLNKVFDEEVLAHSKHLDNCGKEDDLIAQCLMDEDIVVKDGKNKQLLLNSYEYITAGYQTISSILEWSMIFMSKYPDIQSKVHEEIVQIIGNERMPTIEDIESMNYTRAVMDEVLRIGSPTPLRNIYKVLKKTNIDGFDIPVNNLLLVNSYACNTNPAVWQNPFEFNPEHFLRKSDDNSSMKYSPREELINFGLDKKQFFGESLAKSQFFIFFTSIFQRFQISFGDKISETKYKETLQESDGIYRSPNIKHFIFQRQIE